MGLLKGDVLRMATRDNIQIWRFSHEESHGLFITNIIINEDGKELFMWMIAGDGVFADQRHVHFVMGKMEEFAKAMNCKWISGLAIPRLVKFFIRKLGFKTPYVYMLKEV